MEWQPIETAPRDGTIIKARGRDFGSVDGAFHRRICWWEEDGFNGPGWYSADDCHLQYLESWKPTGITLTTASPNAILAVNGSAEPPAVRRP
jgi:hypothetical protein